MVFYNFAATAGVTNGGNTLAVSLDVGYFGSVTIDADGACLARPIASFSTDSGTVGDHLTNDRTPTLTGTAEANSTIKVY